MIEEPYRWVEAIANRREYIETQLAPGSPIAALNYRDGILLVTVGHARQKLFEIYDRIALGAIGHPGDIERLRMAAIELASTEGFTRSAADVSLRRLAFYSLSPLLKTAFEQVYGAPYLARMIFAEVGPEPEADLFLRVEYDGAIAAEAGLTSPGFCAISGTTRATEAMEELLRRDHDPKATLHGAMKVALDAWSVGAMPIAEDAASDLPSHPALLDFRVEKLRGATLEACVLERNVTTAIRYRALTANELATLSA
ncbi:MAG: 20S proteasome subunit A/B [Chthoniobacterales bacterium]|nr:20S proteasome subunit A/B [Chthoniobacterales bacterium]